MAAIREKRLPGIVFQDVSPAPPPDLPPMDVAAFVGFAASGPLHTPVVIEEVAQFRDIFGDDLPLAWDAERGQMQMAHLGPAVRDFFRNGGRRCWVVRVAEAAAASQFTLPFVVALSADSEAILPAYAEARSQGAWADGLHVNTALQSVLLPEAAFSVKIDEGHDEYRIDLSGTVRDMVQDGELLQIEFAGSDITLMLAITGSRVPELIPNVHEQPAPLAWAPRSQGHWFRRIAALPEPAESYSARALLRDESLLLTLVDVDLPDAGATSPGLIDEPARLAVALPPERRLTPGTIITISDGSEEFLFPISSSEPYLGPEAAVSPPFAEITILTAPAIWQLVDRAHGEAAVDGLPHTVSRLRFELLATQHNGQPLRLDGLAFLPAHDRYWGHLPSDERLFAPPPEGVPRPPRGEPGQAIRAEASFPRFPLAWPAGRPETISAFLPIGMPFRVNTTASQGTIDITTPATALERNGLAQFNAAVFLDPDLRMNTLASLPGEAFHKRHVQNLPLQGIHSLHYIEEIALIAVPDAVHRPWQKTTRIIDLLAAPELASPELSGNEVQVKWSSVPNASGYEWQQSNTPDFAVVRHRAVVATTQDKLALAADCPQETWYRVRALRSGEKGPWSNSERMVYPQETFFNCREIVPLAPDLSLHSGGEDEVELAWSAVTGATSYELQRAEVATFDGAVTIFRKDVLHHREFLSAVRLSWFRVRAWFDDLPGPWSVARASAATALTRDAIVPDSDFSDADLLAIHRALLRLCAARADLFAVLATPAHYAEDDVLNYQTRLVPQGGSSMAPSTAGVLPLSLGEIRSASFAALYHPWLIETDERQPLRERSVVLQQTPPDGAMSGQIARRSRLRGAWVAPANETLAGVLSLTPLPAPERVYELFARQVNVLQQETRGFVPISAFTLSPEREWRQINVRRLIILLRRLAVREGDRIVFQPNDLSFRRAMQRMFEAMLERLFQRGAFAGARPEQAFRVVTGESVNTRPSIDAGRFIIELRVAPSHPMMFITVRLVQTVEGMLAEEISTFG